MDGRRNVHAKRISGRSMRRGGITAARLAGVAEDSVDIQFCHGQHRVGRRRYTGDHSVEDLYAVSTALAKGQ